MEKLKTVLILDRDRDVTVETASTMRYFFKEVSVLETNTPEEGIKILKENPIDLVIMDLFIVDGVKISENLGDLNELPVRTLFLKEALHGDQIIEEIKKCRPEAKIVICSTESPYDWQYFLSKHQSVTAKRVLELGFDGFVPKPLDPDVFIRMVENLFNIKAKELR